MEHDIVDGKIGEVGAYDVEFKGGELVASISAGKFGLTAELSVKIGAEAVLEAIKKAIPGEIDDKVIDVIKLALLKK